MPNEKLNVQNGCVDIWLDEIVPCLKDNETGELKETVVFKIESRAYLREFKAKDGWGIDWGRISTKVEVYALALKENAEIQGLVALENNPDAGGVYIFWACSAPRNNKYAFGTQKYAGVGGHLFAIAVDMSYKWGYDGSVYGFALNKDLLKHYIEVLGCSFVGILHPYHFMLDFSAAKNLLEVYTYEWN